MSQPLIDCLQRYPNIRRVLGSAWIEGQEEIDPLDSDYALARWLRHPGFAPDLTVLDSVIAQQIGRPYFRERKDRIRRDPASLMETLAELYFCAWLESLGYLVELTSADADFRIQLDDGSPLLAEMTTPRRAVWSNEVFERVDILSKRYQVSARLEFERELLPASVSSKSAVSEVITRARDLLSSLDCPSTKFIREPLIQAHPDLGLEITWSWTNEAPRTRATYSPEQISEWAAFRIVAQAGSKKARQLPRNQAGVLVVGTRQMPQLLWLSFTSSLQHYPAEDIPFDWSKLPENVKHIILYTYSLDQIQPWERPILISNTSNPLPDPSGFQEFSRRVRPAPLRSDGLI